MKSLFGFVSKNEKLMENNFATPEQVTELKRSLN
jgi:hypothetical protein